MGGQTDHNISSHVVALHGSGGAVLGAGDRGLGCRRGQAQHCEENRPRGWRCTVSTRLATSCCKSTCTVRFLAVRQATSSQAASRRAAASRTPQRVPSLAAPAAAHLLRRKGPRQRGGFATPPSAARRCRPRAERGGGRRPWGRPRPAETEAMRQPAAGEPTISARWRIIGVCGHCKRREGRSETHHLGLGQGGLHIALFVAR